MPDRPPAPANFLAERIGRLNMKQPILVKSGRSFTKAPSILRPRTTAGASIPFAARCAALRRINWVVYAKPPFGGPEQALAYLGRRVRPSARGSDFMALRIGSSGDPVPALGAGGELGDHPRPDRVLGLDEIIEGHGLSKPWHVAGDLPRPGPVWGHRKQSPGNLENALALVKGPESGRELPRRRRLLSRPRPIMRLTHPEPRPPVTINQPTSPYDRAKACSIRPRVLAQAPLEPTTIVPTPSCHDSQVRNAG